MKIASIQVNERRAPCSRNYTRWDVRTQSDTAFDRRRYNRAMTEHNETTRVYVWPKGESIMDNLVNRRTRPSTEYKKLIEPELRAAGYTGRIRWSKHAGCKMCPCSPGFVLDTNLNMQFGEYTPVDVHIDVTE